MRVIAALVLSVTTMTPAQASAAGPPGDRVTIDKLTVNGTGCRADTVAVGLSPDKEAFTVTYSAYLAQAGAGARNKDQRRTCSLTVRLNVPATVQYAITGV